MAESLKGEPRPQHPREKSLAKERPGVLGASLCEEANSSLPITRTVVGNSLPGPKSPRSINSHWSGAQKGRVEGKGKGDGSQHDSFHCLGISLVSALDLPWPARSAGQQCHRGHMRLLGLLQRQFWVLKAAGRDDQALLPL